MAGTRQGGLTAAQKIKERDPDFFKRIGQKGGKVSTPTGGFAYMAKTNPDLLRKISAKGGTISRRKRPE